MRVRFAHRPDALDHRVVERGDVLGERRPREARADVVVRGLAAAPPLAGAASGASRRATSTGGAGLIDGGTPR